MKSPEKFFSFFCEISSRLGGNSLNVDKYYEKWTNSANPETCSDFKKLWENVMIRSCSEAIC